MKKRSIPAALVVVLVLSLFTSTALALNISPFWLYTSSCNPVLKFSGTTANCSLTINCDNSASQITATVRLVHEKKDGTETTIQTWSNLKGTGYLTFSGSKTVIKGETYRLEVDATVKAPTGTEYPYTYVRAKCP